MLSPYTSPAMGGLPEFNRDPVAGIQLPEWPHSRVKTLLGIGREPASTLQLMVQFSVFFAGFAPWREIPGRPMESRKGAKAVRKQSG